MSIILGIICFILITFGTRSRLGLKFKKWFINKIIANINTYHKKDYQLNERNYFEENLVQITMELINNLAQNKLLSNKIFKQKLLIANHLLIHQHQKIKRLKK